MSTPDLFKDRLLKLADFLEKLPNERFNISNWVGSDWEGKSDLSCGTTACMLGWATTIPEFRELGLRLLKSDDGLAFVVLEDVKPWFADYPETLRAGKKIFGLDEFEFEFLFIADGSGAEDISIGGRPQLSSQATPKMAAEHIRLFVQDKYGS